jgi:lysozyme
MRYELTRQLIGDEGKRKCVYKDSLGLYTIGIGRLVDDRKPGAGLRDSEMEFMLRNDIDDRIESLGKRLPWFQNLDDARRGVLLNMSFQLGVEGLLEFKRTLALVEAGKYEEAARNMLVSLWAQQTPERAKRMSEQMRTGRWVYAPGA